MKKRNRQLTEEEKAMHERAVRVRKMTDAQLCDFINQTYGQGMEAGAQLAGGKKIPLTPEETTRRFIQYLESRVGSGNRIGRGTILYLNRELESAIAAGVFAEQEAAE